jgi:hypothetical protein
MVYEDIKINKFLYKIRIFYQEISTLMVLVASQSILSKFFSNICCAFLLYDNPYHITLSKQK